MCIPLGFVVFASRFFFVTLSGFGEALLINYRKNDDI